MYNLTLKVQVLEVVIDAGLVKTWIDKFVLFGKIEQILFF